MSSLTLSDGENLLTTITHLQAVRYLTLGGFTVLLYDVTLTWKEEFDVVWSSGKWTWPKVAYLLNRYGACALSMFYLSLRMVLVILMLLLDAKSSRCKTSASIDMVLDVTIETLGNAIVLYELITLWATRKRMAILMALGFMLLHSATIVSLGIAVKQLREGMGFIHIEGTELRTCFASNNPSAFKGVYIPAVALDIYAFVLLLINALSRPRSSSQRLLDLLLGDGAIFFLTTFSMRMMCLIINLVAPVGSLFYEDQLAAYETSFLFRACDQPSLAVLGLSFASAMVATAVSRLYLRLNDPARRYEDTSRWYDSMYGESLFYDSCEMASFRGKV